MTGDSEEKVEQFCSITGSSAERAKMALTLCNGSLEAAIGMHMDGSLDVDKVDSGDVQVVQDEEDSSRRTRSRHKKSKKAKKRRGRFADSSSSSGSSGESEGEGDGSDVQVVDEVRSSRSNTRRKRALRDPEPGASTSTNSNGGYESDEEVRAPIAPKHERLVDSNRLYPRPTFTTVKDSFGGLTALAGNRQRGKKEKSTLADLFRPPVEIVYMGTFDDAKDMAKRANKWLLANVQDGGDFQCQLLNRDVWSDKAVKELIKKHFVFWQLYRETGEAKRYMTLYPIHSWPNVDILDPRTGEKLITWSKIPDAVCFRDLVNDFLSIHPPLGNNTATKNGTRNKSHNIIDVDEDEQLAIAIQASLAASKTDSKSGNDNSGSDLDLCSEDSSHSVSSLPRTEQKVESKVENGEKIKEIINEDLSAYLGDPSDPSTSISVRFPDGRRETKEVIVKFVENHGFGPEKYEIVTNVPRRVFTAQDRTQTLKDLGLHPREMLFVHEIK